MAFAELLCVKLYSTARLKDDAPLEPAVVIVGVADGRHGACAACGDRQARRPLGAGEVMAEDWGGGAAVLGCSVHWSEPEDHGVANCCGSRTVAGRSAGAAGRGLADV